MPKDMCFQHGFSAMAMVRICTQKLLDDNSLTVLPRRDGLHGENSPSADNFFDADGGTQVWSENLSVMDMDVLVRGCGRDDRDLSPHPRGCKVRRVFSLTRVIYREIDSISIPVVPECTTTHHALRHGRVRLSACRSTSALWNIRTFR